MKKYIPYLVIFLIGALSGMWGCRQYHFRDATKMVQRDTIVRYDTMRYSRLELEALSFRLDVPKVDVPDLAYLDVEKIDTIYKDNVMYISYPRESYYTKTEDAEIWHSGIDCTIDSLNVFRRTETITQTFVPKPKKHSISIGVGAQYCGHVRLPVQIEYAYNIKKWLSVYVYADYDIAFNQAGAGLGAKMRFDL